MTGALQRSPVWLAAAAVMTWCVACSSASHTRVIKPEGTEGTGTIMSGPWLQAGGHWLFTDDATRVLGRDAFDSSTLDLKPPEEGNTGAGLEVGARYTLDEETLGICCFDLGLHIAQMGSGRYRRFETERRIGSMMEVVGDVRWRFVDRSWGGLYVTTGLGWGAVHLSRELEFDLETQGNVGPIEPLQHGLTITMEAGLVWYLDRRLVVRTGLGSRFWQTTLNESSESSLARSRMSLSAGLEWSL